LACFFIFSGLIKANDPLGFSYKLEEYFEVFHLTFLNGFALSMAIILCALEMILGFALLVGTRAVSVVWGLLLLIIFFASLLFTRHFLKWCKPAAVLVMLSRLHHGNRSVKT
jgi:hypothetical protein